MSLTVFYSFLDVVHPFFDNKVIEFIASLPNEYLDNHLLYKKMVLKYYPKYFKKIPRNTERLFFFKKDWNYRVNKIKQKIRKQLEKWHIVPKIIDNYVDYDNWLRDDPLFSNLCQLLKYNGSKYSKYIHVDFEKELLIPHKKEQMNCGRKILIAASIELYLRHIHNLANNDRK